MRLSVRFAEPLSRHSPMRTGGPCEVFAVAHDEEAVLTVLADCRAAKWKVTTLGAGTRTVFRDGGVDGVVLRLGAGFTRCRFVEHDLLFVGGAMPVPAVLAQAASRGLVATDELAAVPGSFAASVLAESWPLVSVRLARPSGVKLLPQDRLGSRSKGVVLGATIRLRQVGVAAAREQLRRAFRSCAVPPGSWVVGAGSVRDVLRKAALDRVRLRAVAIPVEAPEVMVNLGGGTARDLQLLHKCALERVKKTRGVKLGTRMRWIGKRAP